MTPSGALDVRLFAIPTSEVDIRDTWDVTGMRATGSRDAIFVPAELAASLEAPARIDRPT